MSLTNLSTALRRWALHVQRAFWTRKTEPTKGGSILSPRKSNQPKRVPLPAGQVGARSKVWVLGAEIRGLINTPFRAPVRTIGNSSPVNVNPHLSDSVQFGAVQTSCFCALEGTVSHQRVTSWALLAAPFLLCRLAIHVP